jgi:hypothetical protein
MCDLNPKVYNLTASNNPNDYLGNRISYETDSDWKNYQPLMDKVNELTHGLNNDYNKVVAIANWVKNSRPYGEPSPANEFKSIIDIFNSNTGVCLDAAFLTTAMLRIANIPARAVANLPTAFAFHEFTEAYVNGKWIEVDATFGNGDAFIRNESLYSSGIHEYYTFANSIKEPVYGQTYYNANFYKVKSISSKDYEKYSIYYGTLIFPTTAKIAGYYNPDAGQLSSAKLNENMVPVFVSAQYLEVKNKNCLESAGITLGNAFPLPGFHYDAEDSSGQHRGGEPMLSGYITTELPACSYRIHYAFSYGNLNVDSQKLAYFDFEIKNKGDVVKIMPSSLSMFDGGNQNYFNKLIQAFDDIPSYEEIS